MVDDGPVPCHNFPPTLSRLVGIEVAEAGRRKGAVGQVDLVDFNDSEC